MDNAHLILTGAGALNKAIIHPPFDGIFVLSLPKRFLMLLFPQGPWTPSVHLKPSVGRTSDYA